ncbi:hypothetical protein D3C86_1821290 [compost metagenome]
MGVRIVRVPVIDRHPVQAGFQIDLHALHQLTRVAAQVFQLLGVLHRNNEAELVPVTPPTLLEGLQIRRVRGRTVGLTALPVASDAVALDVVQVRSGRAGGCFLEDHETGLDDHAPAVRREPAAGYAGHHAPAPEGGCWPPTTSA